MKIKASLHIHTTEDKIEGYIIKYNIYQLVDYAAELGFKVLALTCHQKLIYSQKYYDYAVEHGILLIFGIELYLKENWFFRNDVIVLNIKPEQAKIIEKLKTVEDLVEYKKNNSEIFIVVPHPLFFYESIGKKRFIKFIDLFDAVEHSWFYSKLIDANKLAQKIAHKYGKPFIATADMHILTYFDSDYIIIDAPTMDIKSVLQAIKLGRFNNITRPKKLTKMIFSLLNFLAKKVIFFPWRTQHNKKYEI